MATSTEPSSRPNLDPLCCAPFGCTVNTYRYQVGTMETDVRKFLDSIGITYRVTSRLRSCDEQAALWRAGQSPARPSTSQHEFGLAFDIVPTGGYQRYGATFRSTVTYIVELARALGYDGIDEKTHAHVQWYTSASWGRFIKVRDIGLSIPIPGGREKPPRFAGAVF